MNASLFSALAEGSGLDEETLYDLFIDGLTGNIRDAVLFAELLPMLDQVIRLAVQMESLWQENQAQLDTPVQSPSPVPVWAPSAVPVPARHPAPALRKVRLKHCKPLRCLLGPKPCGSLRAAVSLMTHAWLEAPALFEVSIQPRAFSSPVLARSSPPPVPARQSYDVIQILRKLSGEELVLHPLGETMDEGVDQGTPLPADVSD